MQPGDDAMRLLLTARTHLLRIHGPRFFVLHEKFDQRRHRSHLLLLHKPELHDEENEALEARVEVRLGAKCHELVKVVVIYVRVRTEQALEQQLHQRA